MISGKSGISVKDHVKDVAGLASFFFEAADTERRLPSARRQSVNCCWPDYADDPSVAFGYNDTVTRLAKASPGAITRYDQALELCLLLDVDERRVIWASAHSAVRRQRGPTWRAIGKLLGMQAATVKRRFESAILSLWYKM